MMTRDQSLHPREPAQVRIFFRDDDHVDVSEESAQHILRNLGGTVVRVERHPPAKVGGIRKWTGGD